MSPHVMIPGLKKILVATKNWLGDAVCITPAIAAVKAAYPDATISVLAHPRCAEVFTGNPAVHRVLPYAGQRGAAGLLDIARLWRLFAAGQYDAVFLFHRSRSKAIIAALAGIRYRIGFNTKGRGVFLTHSVPEPAGMIHMADYHLALLAACGIAAAQRHSQFFVSNTDRERGGVILADAGLQQGTRYAVINPGGNWERKRWPAANFARLADRIAQEFGVRIVITGGEKEQALAREIAGLMKNAPLIAAGQTTLKTLAAIIEKAVLYIGNDSGPTHIAAALGTPLVAIFGPTSPVLTGPAGSGSIVILRRDVGCAVPCYAPVCARAACMEAVTADDVFARVRNILDDRRK